MKQPIPLRPDYKVSASLETRTRSAEFVAACKALLQTRGRFEAAIDAETMANMFNDPVFREEFSKGLAGLLQELVIAPLKREIAELRSVEVQRKDHIERLEARVAALETRDQQAPAKLRLLSDGSR
jgi:hypothetical protein